MADFERVAGERLRFLTRSCCIGGENGELRRLQSGRQFTSLCDARSFLRRDRALTAVDLLHRGESQRPLGVEQEMGGVQLTSAALFSIVRVVLLMSAAGLGALRLAGEVEADVEVDVRDFAPSFVAAFFSHFRATASSLCSI